MLIDTHAHYNSCVVENIKNEIDIVNKNKDVTKIIPRDEAGSIWASFY